MKLFSTGSRLNKYSAPDIGCFIHSPQEMERKIQVRRPPMHAAVSKERREDLFRQISDILNEWPDLERQVFSLAHYHGQSPDDISRSLKLNGDVVMAILRRCECGLHDSLRNFFGNTDGKSSLVQDEKCSLLDSAQDFNAVLASRLSSVREKSNPNVVRTV